MGIFSKIVGAYNGHKATKAWNDPENKEVKEVFLMWKDSPFCDETTENYIDFHSFRGMVHNIQTGKRSQAHMDLMDGINSMKTE